MLLVVINDVKSRHTSAPVAVENRDIAIRDFATLVNSPQSMQHKYPDDFSLFCVGEYNDCNKSITSVSPELLVNAVDVLVKKD